MINNQSYIVTIVVTKVSRNAILETPPLPYGLCSVSTSIQRAATKTAGNGNLLIHTAREF